MLPSPGSLAATLFLVNARAHRLKILASRGKRDSAHADTAVNIELSLSSNSIAAHVARTGEPVNLADAYDDARFDRTIDARTGFRTCVPRTSEGPRLLFGSRKTTTTACTTQARDPRAAARDGRRRSWA